MENQTIMLNQNFKPIKNEKPSLVAKFKNLIRKVNFHYSRRPSKNSTTSTNNLTISKKILPKKYVPFIIVGIIFFLLGIIGTLIYTHIKERNDNVSVNTINLKIFKSKGSRDPSKEEKYAFSITDPIQAQINFQTAAKGTIILFEITKSASSIQKTEVPIEGSGERFVTIFPAPWKLDKGEYLVTLKQNNILLKETKFNIE